MRNKSLDKEAGDEDTTEEMRDGRNMETQFHHLEKKDLEQNKDIEEETWYV